MYVSLFLPKFLGRHTLLEFSDELMKFYKQIGVNYVDMMDLPEYHTTTRLDPKNVSKAIKRVRTAGLNIVNFNAPPIRDFLMGRHGGERQIEDLINFIKILGAESVPLANIHMGVRGGMMRVPGYFQKEHRGGYKSEAFSLELMRRQLAEKDMDTPWAHHFTEEITFNDYWSNCVKAYERIIPAAEDSEVKLVIHPDDPPVPNGGGLLPGITNSLIINRLFDAVPSKNVGIIFCCGVRYESGEDIYDQIRIFGRQKKIFHVHLRNVRGTIPSTGGYEETFLDDGDMNMFEILQALKEVKYNGALNPDHIPTLVSDPDGNASVAWLVGYIKALLVALNS